MTLPNQVSNEHIDEATDDARQWRQEGKEWADAINQLITHLASSPITSTPLGLGDGVEASASNLRVKLDGGTILRSSSGIKVDVGTGANDIVQLDGTGKLPAVDGSQLTGVVSVPTGAVSMFAGAAAPSGWLLCNGAAVSRTTFAGLFAVIGTAYGAGDGSTTFNVPDLRGRAPIGAGTGAGLTNRTLAGTAGSQTISIAQMPAHTHTFSGTTSSAGSHTHSQDVSSGGSVTTNNIVESGTTNGTIVSGSGINAAGAHTHTVSGTTSSTGSGAADGNMQPSLVLNFIIKA